MIKVWHNFIRGWWLVGQVMWFTLRWDENPLLVEWANKGCRRSEITRFFKILPPGSAPVTDADVVQALLGLQMLSLNPDDLKLAVSDMKNRQGPRSTMMRIIAAIIVIPLLVGMWFVIGSRTPGVSLDETADNIVLFSAVFNGFLTVGVIAILRNYFRLLWNDKVLLLRWRLEFAAVLIYSGIPAQLSFGLSDNPDLRYPFTWFMVALFFIQLLAIPFFVIMLEKLINKKRSTS